ncbi:hypothetical protein ABIA30_001761 [Mycobacterium sp. MAA66]|uniref:glycoside hydrolase family 27 protein n=1 Tax=Mycobacterium sp. MAA66 TaxID=3156297 RepID=UPI0035182280
MNRAARLPALLVTVVLSLVLVGASAPPPMPKADLAATPPMGWSSWNAFGCGINEQLVRETADAMVASGMAAAGYHYVDVDDCWMAPVRGSEGRLQADHQRFPSGIKALADYVHSRGLKFGIYSSAGLATCEGRPASLHHEAVDAQTFADWGVDLLKYDNCYATEEPAVERYRAMARALRNTGRQILYAICEWGYNRPWQWAAASGGHTWRTTPDIADNWRTVMAILDRQVPLAPYSGPNGWNDMDSLEIGNGGMSTEEDRAHLSLWALLNAPLIAGNDLRSMSPTTQAMLTNPEVLAIDRDWAGTQGHLAGSDGVHQVWTKPLSTGGVAVVFLNRDRHPAVIATTAQILKLPPARDYRVHDVWTGGTVAAVSASGADGDISAPVPPHAVKMYVMTPEN